MPATKTKIKASKTTPKTARNNTDDTRLSYRVGNYKVNRDAGVLSDVVLLESDREAEGHRVWIDDKTLQTALDSLDGVDKLKAYIAHETFEQYWNDEDRLMTVPGWFEGLHVSGGKLRAARFTFYDSFKADAPAAYAKLIEMAEKTPELFGLSIEFYGYAVYVDTDGKEYGESPDDTDLLYNGMPAVRVNSLDAAAFVSEPAATSGLFAKVADAFAGRGKSRISPDDLALILQSFKAFHAEKVDSQPASEDRTQNALNTNPTITEMETLIKALATHYTDDRKAYSRALVYASDNFKEGMTLADVQAALKAEDDAEALKAAKEKAAQFDALEKEKTQLETEKAELEKKFKTLKESGHIGGEIDLGAGNGDTKPAGRFTGKTAEVFQHFLSQGKKAEQFAITRLDDLWVPDIWVPGMAEQVPLHTDILSSKVFVSPDKLIEKAQGEGQFLIMPNLREPDISDETQQEGVAPATNKITSGQVNAPFYNRVVKFGADAISAIQSGTDPVGAIFGFLGRQRSRNRLRLFIAMLRGIFGNTLATTGAWEALRIKAFDEEGSNATSNHLWDGDKFADATGLLGEMKGLLENGLLLVHSDIETAMTKQEDITFYKPSGAPFGVSVYKEKVPVMVCDLLSRAGTTDGVVYDSYLFGPGTVGHAERTQGQKVGDQAHIIMKEDEDLNENLIYDRSRFVLQPNFANFVVANMADAKEGPTNAEAAAVANWTNNAADIKNVGITQITTNG